MTTNQVTTSRPTWATVAGTSSAVLAGGVLLYAMGFVGLGAAIVGIGVTLITIAVVGLASAAAAYFFSRRG